MSQEPFVRTTQNRALDEELRRLRERPATEGGSDAALLAVVQALASEVSSQAIQIAQLKQGRVVVRESGGTDEQGVRYIEFDGNEFEVSGTGTVRRVDLGVGTTKGDLIVWNNTPQPARLPIGTDGYYLTPDAAQALGMKWAAFPAASQVCDYTDNNGTTINFSASAAGMDFVRCTNASAVTFNLPTAVGLTDHIIAIKRTAAVNAVTVTPNGSETIDGAASKSLGSQYASLTIISDGSNWHVWSTFGTVT